MKKVSPFVSVGEGKTYRMADSHMTWHMDRYERVEFARLPPAAVVKSRPLLRRYPNLAQLGDCVYVPKLFAMHIPKERREMVSGIKVCSRSFLTDREFVLNLKDLGFSDKDEYQAFREVTKGVGVRIDESSFVDFEGITRLARKHGYLDVVSTMGLEDNVINRGNHEFDAPEGGELGEDTIEAIRRFNKALTGEVDIKVTPLACGVKLPEESQVYAGELADSLSSKSPLYQEKLLFPSVLRMVYFEAQPKEELSELCLYISDSPKELEKTRGRVFEDAVKFFEVVPRNTYRYGKGFWWVCPFDIWLAYGSGSRVYNSPSAWFLAKDILLARTGAYYTDFEGWDYDSDETTKGETQRKQHIHLTNAFKVFSRFQTLFGIGIEQVKGKQPSRAKAAKIERESLGRLMDTINESEFLEVTDSGGVLDLRTYSEYEGVANGRFRINKEHLFPMYQ